MKQLYTFFLLIITLQISAQTEVSGNQSGTWTYNDSPYLITGNISVPAGQILTIEPGVIVKFTNHYKFNVYGKLLAQGTETDSIFFTTDNASIGWGGIRINGSQDNVFNYCRLEFGKTQGDYPDDHGGAIALFNSNAQFEHCVFANNTADIGDDGMGGAVYAVNASGTTEFVDCKFMNNHTFGEGGAVKLISANGVKFIRCSFLENDCKYGGGAVSCYSAANIDFVFCLFAGNYTLYSAGGAVQTLGMDNSLNFENCTLYGNSANNGDGGAVSLAYAEANFVNSIIYNNPGAYSNNIYLDIAGYAEINYCDTPFPDGATGGNNINSDPLFVNVGEKDFRLTENSPCVDAGMDIGYDYLGLAPDMGCFEYDPATGITDNNNGNISLFPNPAADFISIYSPFKIISVDVYDSFGKIALKHRGDSSLIGLKGAKSGAYIVIINTEKGKFSKRLIISR